MEKHYVYRLEDITTGEFYWGVRTCKCEIKDDKYMGSMKTWKPDKSNLIKTDVIEYNLRGEANKAEVIIISFYYNKKKFPLNRNYCASINFDTPWNKGVLRTEIEKENIRIGTIKNQPIITDEMRKKMSLKGEKNGMYGKKHSKETKDKMRTPKSEDTKIKLSLAKLNNPKNKGYRIRPNGKYDSAIKYGDKQIYLGTFNTEEDAKQAYINAKIKYYNIK